MEVIDRGPDQHWGSYDAVDHEFDSRQQSPFARGVSERVLQQHYGGSVLPYEGAGSPGHGFPATLPPAPFGQAPPAPLLPGLHSAPPYEITGLIIACVLVRPSKDIRDLTVKSVKKKWKDKSFAAGVDRDHVQQATTDFSNACFDGQLDLWQHASNVIEAMQSAAEALELKG